MKELSDSEQELVSPEGKQKKIKTEIGERVKVQASEKISSFNGGAGLVRFRINEQDAMLQPMPILDSSIAQHPEPKFLKVFGGKVKQFIKVVYENDFLEDFLASYLRKSQDSEHENNGVILSTEEAEVLNQDQPQQPNDGNNLLHGPEILYQAYIPQNTTELREYMMYLICKKIRKSNKKHLKQQMGNGQAKFLSNKLIKYLSETNLNKKKLLSKYNNEVLIFDSIFECGNLLQAEMINLQEYQLYMQVDTNTRGHQQWFYFRVRNLKPDKKYIFRIMNFTKPGLLSSSNNANTGLSNQQSNVGQSSNNVATGANNQNSNSQNNPSKKEHLQRIHFKSKNETDWRQIDSDQLEFVKTDVQRKRKDIIAAAADSDQEDIPDEQNEEIPLQNMNSQKFFGKKGGKKRKPQFFYALQFEFQTASADEDTYYFAFSLPLTLTDITEMILEKENQLQDLVQKEGHNYQAEGEISNQAKFIVENNGLSVEIPSRVHAAETPGSYVFQGIYNFLTSNASEAKFLRKFYTFLLVPTLNPDGVVCGNYRSSVAGVDLNRQWISPCPDFHPEIFSIKSCMKNIVEKE